MRELRVGLVGLGHVGSAAARLIIDNAERFEKRLGARVVLHSVCDRHPAAKVRAARLPRSVKVLKDWRKVVEDPAVDIVVELIGGKTEARALVLESLRRGKDVVTANKALLSSHWEEVFGAAYKESRQLGFEASVAGGIPLLGALNQSLAANRVRQILGILNGTTNFILSRMVHEHQSLAEALKEAQRLGLAERDPSLDLSGTDAAHKLSVLASLVLGRWLPPSAVAVEGIEGVDLEDVLFAVSELGRTVRLLGLARFSEGPGGAAVEAGVHPTLIPLEHPLAAVHGAYNAVMLETSEARDLMFYGLGAGPGPAASSVVGDVFMLAQGQLGGRAVFPALWSGGAPVRPLAHEAGASQFYLRFTAQDRPGVLGRLATELGRQGVSIAQIYQRPKAGGGRVPVVIVTHEAPEGRLRSAIRAAVAKGGVDRKVRVLRML